MPALTPCSLLWKVRPMRRFCHRDKKLSSSWLLQLTRCRSLISTDLKISQSHKSLGIDRVRDTAVFSKMVRSSRSWFSICRQWWRQNSNQKTARRSENASTQHEAVTQVDSHRHGGCRRFLRWSMGGEQH